MEYFGVFAFILMLAYSSYPGKVKRLEAKLKRFEKMEKKKGLITKLFRIENIDEVEIIE